MKATILNADPQVPFIEVYGQCEEYLQTVKGDLLDEVDGSPLYECKADLKKLQSEISLKVRPNCHLFTCMFRGKTIKCVDCLTSSFCLQFCKHRDPNSIWIYGLSFATKTIAARPNAAVGFGPTGGMNQLLSSLMLGASQPVHSPTKASEGLDLSIDRKLREMEERIKKHVDHRLDAIEKKLSEDNEKLLALLSSLSNK